jgi:hypothetical protein
MIWKGEQSKCLNSSIRLLILQDTICIVLTMTLVSRTNIRGSKRVKHTTRARAIVVDGTKVLALIHDAIRERKCVKTEYKSARYCHRRRQSAKY